MISRSVFQVSDRSDRSEVRPIPRGPGAGFCPGSRTRRALERSAACLSVAVVLSLAGASQSRAQVTFDEVETALSALEQSLGETSGAGQAAPVVTPPPVTETTPPPGIELPLTALPDGNGASFGGVDFLPILTDQACPRRLPEIGEQARSLTGRAVELEGQALSVSARFAELEEQNRAFEIDQNMLECPSDFVREAENFRSDLSRLQLGGLVQEAETFSVCAQDGLQALNARMVELAQSTAPEAAADRLAVGDVLRRWAAADAEVTEAVSSFVFFDQRRIRLETAITGMLRRCELLGGYE